MARRTCFDCDHCDEYEVKDGKVWCKYYHAYYDPNDAYSCNRFEMGSSGSSGCYLTTACVDVMGLSDDCTELQSMRLLRDEYIMREVEDGKKIIDDYYLTAPVIVSEINKQSDSEEIWKNIYQEEIKPCVDLIKHQKYEQALSKYQEMTQRLSKQYIQ